MSTCVLFEAPWFTALDANADPIDGGKCYFYLSGTLTPAAVYHDDAGATPWTFPAVTDSAGRIVIYLAIATGNLKFILTDANDVPVGATVDPVTPSGARAGSGLGEVFVFCANSASLVTTTTYISGATFDKLQPGSSVWSVDSATLTGTYVLEIDGAQNTAGTLSVALVNLTDGAPDTPIATATITSTTGARAVSGAITFPGGGAAKVYGIKAKTSANSAFVIGARISRTV